MPGKFRMPDGSAGAHFYRTQVGTPPLRLLHGFRNRPHLSQRQAATFGREIFAFFCHLTHHFGDGKCATSSADGIFVTRRAFHLLIIRYRNCRGTLMKVICASWGKTAISLHSLTWPQGEGWTVTIPMRQ